jgi:N-acetylglucosaminyldiphosphoundecaprenol N-acetyl-beta-D-mannosaminyltransferase
LAPRVPLRILGVEILDLSMREAVDLVAAWLRGPGAPGRTLYFANAHTLNLAREDPSYREVLNAADAVFGDGAGIRLAARLHGIRLRDNVNGTDFVPRLLRETANRGHSYYLMGDTPEVVRAAAAAAALLFPGWAQVGHHQGFFGADENASILEEIRRASPTMLLVGMGNPLQERWIHTHRERLEVPLSIAVGGLFNYWAGSLERAPAWVRQRGFEWLYLLLRQPRKFRRYVIGNPKFLWRIASERLRDR